jgi:hypothetical protein
VDGVTYRSGGRLYLFTTVKIHTVVFCGYGSVHSDMLIGWEFYHLYHHHHHHHHHRVYEGLGVFPVPWSSKWNWSLHLFLGRPTFLLPFGLYCSACFGILFVSILCTCCSHFCWYCFISFTILPFFPLMHWFCSLSSFVIPGWELFERMYSLHLHFYLQREGCMYLGNTGTQLPECTVS